MKFVAVFILMLSTQAKGQSNGSVDTSTSAAFKSAAERMRAVNQASESLSIFGKDTSLINNYFVNICQRAVYESTQKEGSAKSIDLISDLDVRICVENLSITLASFIQKK